MEHYLLDANGYLIGTCSGIAAPQPSTDIPPPIGIQKPQFVNGAWLTGQYQHLTPMQFYLAFTPTERMAIKKSADPVVVEFWATYQLAVQTGTSMDPNLVSVQEALTYLATPTTATPPGAGILASAARVTAISQGVPQ